MKTPYFISPDIIVPPKSCVSGGSLCSAMALIFYAALWTPAKPALAQTNPDAVPHKIAPKNEPFVFPDTPIRNLTSHDSEVRQQAAYLLGNRTTNPDDRSQATKAVPALIVALKDSNATVRGAAAFALGNIKGDAEATVPALVAATHDADGGVRTHAARSLGLMNQMPELAVPALMRLLKSSDPSEREDSSVALQAFGANAQPAVPELITLAGQKNDAGLAIRALKVLAAIGPAASPAEAVLVEILGRTRSSNGEAYTEEALEAADALGHMGRDQPEAVEVATSLLDVEYSGDRARAAGVLGDLGPAAAPSIPVLVKAFDDKDSDVGWIAANSITRIAASLRDAHETSAIKPLEEAVKAMEQDRDPRVKAQARLCRNAVADLQKDLARGSGPH